MANRTLGDFTRSRLGVPEVPQDLSGANLLNMVSRQTGKLADEAITQWQESEKSKASAEGTAAGWQPNVKYREGGTITAQAYNKAASESLRTSTDLKAKTGLQELAEVYKDNPAEFQTKSSEFIANITNSLKQAGDMNMAKEVEASMTLSAQTAGYEISKAYNAKMVDQAKADNEMLGQTLKTDAYKGSGGLFSKDPEEQGIALTKFAVNKKAYEASLHKVLPDGTPVYSAVGIQKRMKAFHESFYTGAVQNWVSEAELSASDLKKIKDGDLTINIPGVGSINVLDEVGVDVYDQKVRRYTVTKIREKVAARDKELDVENKLMAQRSKANDVELLNKLYTGQPVSAATIQKDVSNGKLSLPTAKSALKMIYDPETIKDDKSFVAELKIKQIQGVDITEEVKANAHRISGTSYTTLLTNAAKGERTLQKEDEKWIVREMVKKSGFGIEDPKSLRLASDTVDSYRQKIKDGESPEVAFEETRNTMDALKDRANRRAFNSVPIYAVIENNTINLGATADATQKALEEGKITEEKFNIEMNRLRSIHQRKRGGE